MTNGTTLPKTSAQTAQKPFAFPLPSEVDWYEGPRSSFAAVGIEPNKLFLAFTKVTSASSIRYREMIPVWQQPNLLSLVEQLYIFRRRAEVIAFLQSYQFLITLLIEAYYWIEVCFGPYPQVFLEVVTDPEAIDDRQLVVFIRTDLDPVEALAKLDRLDKSWWLKASHGSRGKLCIHLE